MESKKSPENVPTPGGNRPGRENARPADEIARLSEKVRELEETLIAIRSGEVDAIIVPDGEEQKIYTLEGQDSPYRDLVENIREGALTLSRNGTILYANTQFSAMVKLRPETVTGTSLQDHICPAYLDAVNEGLRTISREPYLGRIRIYKGKGSLPVFLSMSPLSRKDDTKISVIVTDRSRDEEQIQLQARMLDAVADAVIAADPRGKIIYWNRAATRTYGWEPEEVLGKDLVSILVPEVSVEDSKKILRNLAKGEIWAGEYIMKHRDGHLFPAYVSDSPVFDENGRLIAVLGASHDISDRKAAEAALREKHDELTRLTEKLTQSNEILTRNEQLLKASEERYHRLVDLSPDAIIVHQDGRYVYANPAALRLFGAPAPGRFIGMNVLDLVAPGDRELIASRIHTVLDKGGSTPLVHTRILRLDGSAVDVESKATDISFNNSPAVMVVLRDISDRIKTEEALAVAHQQIQDIIDNTTSIVYALDRDEHFVMVNTTLARLLQSTPEQMIGRRRHEFMPKEDADCHDANDRKVLESGTVQDFEEYSHIGNRSITWLTTKFPLRDAGGMIYAVAGISTDITERNRMEYQIRRSEEQYRELAEKAGTIILRFDTKGKITYANEYALDFFGYSSGELIGKPLIGTIIPEKELSTGRDLTGMVNEIVRDPSLFARHENEARMKNGNLVWIRWTNTPLLNPEGTIREFTKVGIDITDMKRAEHALKKTTQYLENLFDYANAPIIVWDRDFRITRFNHAFELLTDRKASEVLGQDLAIIFPEQYTGQALDMIRRTMTGEHLETVEIPVQTRNGETRIVLWNSATLTEADGKTVESTIAQGQDITERKRAEAALRLSEERFRELAESAGSIILRYDCRGRITYFNEYAEKFFGFSRDEILGKSGVGTIIPVQESGSGRDLGKMVSDIVDKPDQYAENENENIRKNGERVWIHWTNRPVYNPDGTIREFTAIGSDITDRRFAEMELERKNMDLNAVNEELRATQEELRRNVAKLTRREHQLEEALAEKEILLSEIHHRVKNNLSAFISLLSLDGTYEKTDAGQMLRQDLQNRARSMALIHETLYRTGKFSNVDMEIYLTTLIEQVAGTYAGKNPVRTIVDARGVTLDLARATTAGLIINELVTNSFKYAFPPGFDCQGVRNEPCTIRVTFTCEGGSYRLIVSDNGRGLPEEIDPRSTKSLGLKLVTFLARHQLRATTDIRTDRGTSFIFHLNKEDTIP